ncbi:MAG: hypothetical protein KJ970_07895 [Candidatus Eisenbacteria bacterium]|uniref:MrpA C-terminal/MbhE domain-containing protein n=1 Tax=Eiseniibacteriota bacterium TaxID=2212470 RepID=A0A948RWH7_UNCEI|nr:hypothetical protein [Candidatus Eisenbacteria bacterium]MBU1947469.1 hypothetical protein [Candidatus Eisenbacteria bacterium]MBU2690838.1 hypothetical protein [Candidatus Eisenbacteria bacterium]
MKILSYIILIAFGLLMIITIADMPPRGDIHSPAAEHVSPDYIKNAEHDMATPNIVTAILADYRGYDTLGETTVIFAAGLACMLILYRKERTMQEGRKK